MKLFFTVCALVLVAQSIAIGETVSAKFQDLPDIFFETGYRECDLDCSNAASEAEADALAAANAVCKPVLARQVSRWNIRVVGYGRLYASAAFSCDTNAHEAQPSPFLK